MRAEEGPIHVQVAEAFGWTAYREKRGSYNLCVTVPPGGQEPWKSTRLEFQQPERYTRVSCAEAHEIGFYGNGFPRCDVEWGIGGPLIERYRISLDCDSSLGVGPWCAIAYDESHYTGGDTPLLAVCQLILALKAAGKLEA